eukprot:jgi/Ulvmu1/628/UM001_0636.1
MTIDPVNRSWVKVAAQGEARSRAFTHRHLCDVASTGIHTITGARPLMAAQPLAEQGMHHSCRQRHGRYEFSSLASMATPASASPVPDSQIRVTIGRAADQLHAGK